MMARSEIIKYMANQPMIRSAKEKEKLDVLRGKDRADYVKSLPKLSLSDRQIDRYIRFVREKWEKQGFPGKKEMKVTIMNMFRYIIARCMNSMDYRSAIMAADSLRKMFGLDSPTQIEGGMITVSMSMEELHKSMEKIEKAGK